MEACLLCLEMLNKDVESTSICVNSIQWQELNIQTLIEKHLWTMPTIQLTSRLCNKCWEELSDFHNFYIRIQDTHMQFGSIVKMEISNEREMSMLENVKTEASIAEQKYIKLETNKDLWDDNTTLTKISKRKNKEVTIAAKEPLIKLKPKHSNTTNSTKTKTRELSSGSAASKEILNKFQIKQSKDLLENKELNSDYNNEPDNESTNKEKNAFIAKNLDLNCILCQIPMETFRDLCLHFRSEHNEPGYVICCNTKFFKRSLLLDHLHLHLDPDYLKCKDCGKICADSVRLNQHKKIHDTNRERKFCCDICGIRFVTNLSLENHKTRHLTEEEKLFPCPKCGKRFGNKWTLSGHVRTIHESSISCDICGDTLINKSALNIHKRVKHTVSELKECKCPICSKILSNEHAVKIHIRYNHQLGYNHKCTICNKAFKRARALKQHMGIHSDTPMFSCPWCPKTFKTHSNIPTHHAKWHPKEYEEEKSKKKFRNVPFKINTTNSVNDNLNTLNIQ